MTFRRAVSGSLLGFLLSLGTLSPARGDFIVNNLGLAPGGSQTIGAFYITPTNFGGGGSLAQQFLTGPEPVLLGNVLVAAIVQGQIRSPIVAGLYDDANGQPGTMQTGFALDAFGTTFTPVVTDLLLAPNTTYWFQIGMNPGALTSPATVTLAWRQSTVTDSGGSGELGNTRRVYPGGTEQTWSDAPLMLAIDSRPVPEVAPGHAAGALALLIGAVLCVVDSAPRGRLAS